MAANRAAISQALPTFTTLPFEEAVLPLTTRLTRPQGIAIPRNIEAHGLPLDPVILDFMQADGLQLPAGDFQVEQRPLKGRAWGPEQATGAPDTLTAGDQQTAWASKTQDGQREWLLLEYAEAIKISKIKIHESFNPGALSQISIFDDAGRENPVWIGQDPTPVTAAMGVSTIEIDAPQRSKKVKLYIDSPAVPGWNEIDAVSIEDQAGKIQWAIRATASSFFGEPKRAPAAVAPTAPVAPVAPAAEQF